MSIKLRFEKGALVVQASLKDEALAKLMALVQEHQAEEPTTVPEDTILDFGGGLKLSVPAEPEINPEKSSKEWLACHSAVEVLNAFKWDTWPDKILALGAYHESKSGDDFESWRSADIIECFGQTRQGEPTNFPRDISVAIKSGLIAPVTPRTYKVSVSGWRKIAAAVDEAVRDAKVLTNYPGHGGGK